MGHSDISNGINIMLYVLKKMGGKTDFIHICKTIYFADREHLARYGSLFSEDRYIAMKDGPVPSTVYDILSALSGEGALKHLQANFLTYFKLEKDGHTVKALQSPDLEKLSKSSIGCLDRSIAENRDLDYETLSNKSHDGAWAAAKRNDAMNALKIAEVAGADSDAIDYITSHYEMLSLDLDEYRA
jgi:uncharacterized phage-associated protein